MHEQTERGLARILEAKDREVVAIVAAKDAQIADLRAETSRLRAAVEHERARAEAAIDQRLQAAAGFPVRDADLQRKLAEKEADGALAPAALEHAVVSGLPKDKQTELSRVFSELATVGEDSREPDPVLPDRFVAIGGQPVA